MGVVCQPIDHPEAGPHESSPELAPAASMQSWSCKLQSPASTCVQAPSSTESKRATGLKVYRPPSSHLSCIYTDSRWRQRARCWHFKTASIRARTCAGCHQAASRDSPKPPSCTTSNRPSSGGPAWSSRLDAASSANGLQPWTPATNQPAGERAIRWRLRGLAKVAAVRAAWPDEPRHPPSAARNARRAQRAAPPQR